MNKYEYLAKAFQDALGVEFNLVYNNDESIAWEDILLGDMISGVMHVNSGNYDKINGYSVSTQQVSIQFMIPTITEIFSKAIQTIEDTFKGFHNQMFESNNEIVKVLFNYISDANRVLINGTDYATVYVYVNLFSVENALMSNETTILIDEQRLNGVFHVTYSNTHTADGIVKGNISLIQKNLVNAIQQSLTIDLVAIKGDEVIKDLIDNSISNKTYTIKYNNGIRNRTFKGYVANLIEDGTFNDTLKIKITFGWA
jgi:uncharacterized protein YggL (DUF469 family)